MSDNPFKVGDKIKVLHSDKTRDDLWDQVGEVVKIAATTIGGYSMVHVMLPHHKISSYKPDYLWGFIVDGFLTERLYFADKQAASVVSAIRQEKPCQVCQRPNDLGVKSCWSCGNAPF